MAMGAFRLLTLDKAPACPFDGRCHQDSSSIVSRPSEAGLRLDSETSSTRYFGCFRGCQIDHKVIEVNVQILVYQYALGRLGSDRCVDSLDVAVCSRQEVAATFLRCPVANLQIWTS